MVKAAIILTIYKVYCGLDTNGHDVNASQIAHDLAAKYFPNGHTVYEANGRWIGEVGVIDEPTIIIEFLTTTPKEDAQRVGKFAFDYKNLAFQESVLVTSREQDAWFI